MRLAIAGLLIMVCVKLLMLSIGMLKEKGPEPAAAGRVPVAGRLESNGVEKKRGRRSLMSQGRG